MSARGLERVNYYDYYDYIDIKSGRSLSALLFWVEAEASSMSLSNYISIRLCSKGADSSSIKNNYFRSHGPPPSCPGTITIIITIASLLKLVLMINLILDSVQ